MSTNLDSHLNCVSYSAVGIICNELYSSLCTDHLVHASGIHRLGGWSLHENMEGNKNPSMLNFIRLMYQTKRRPSMYMNKYIQNTNKFIRIYSPRPRPRRPRLRRPRLLPLRSQ